jgi:hypothetical protein
VYRIAVDPTYNGLYSAISYSGSVPLGIPVSGSLYGGMRLSPVFRLGGAHEYTLSIKCSMKNSIAIAANLADLAEIYVKLGQYGVIDRMSTANAKVDLSRFVENGVPFFTSKGIAIKEVRRGGLETRKRGDNDNVFSMSVSVDVRSEWNMDFNEEHILDIDEIFGPY